MIYFEFIKPWQRNLPRRPKKLFFPSSWFISNLLNSDNGIYQGVQKKLFFPSAWFISNLLNPDNGAASIFETSVNIYSDDPVHKTCLRNESDLKSFKHEVLPLNAKKAYKGEKRYSSVHS